MLTRWGAMGQHSSVPQHNRTTLHQAAPHARASMRSLRLFSHKQSSDSPNTTSASRSSSSSASQSEGAALCRLAGEALTTGNGLARYFLASPGIEGDPLGFLRTTEAYWKALRNQKHEPHKKGPTVVTSSQQPFASLMQQHQQQQQHATHGSSAADSPSTSASAHQTFSPSFGAAPSSRPAATDFDVIMCGGTLGLAVAAALQLRGFRVCVVEKRLAEGRTQEWNTSRHELQVLVSLGLLTQAELEAAIASEFGPVRVGFRGAGAPLWVADCLNLGVCPRTLLAALRRRFEVAGGVVYEHTAFKRAVVCRDGVVVELAEAAELPAGLGDVNRPNALRQQRQQRGQQEKKQQAVPLTVVAAGGQFRAVGGSNGNGHSSNCNGHAASSGNSHSSNGHSRSSNGNGHGASPLATSSDGHSTDGHRSNGHSSNGAAAGGAVPVVRRPPSRLSCRLLLDCMGHFSPIVKQIRGRAKPDGMVLVVGGCATGFPTAANTSADLLYSLTDAAADMQLFWEAFPAEGGAARTTYMFAYTDADPSRPSFERLLDAYFGLLPAYQNLPGGTLDSINFKRVLFGGFPCFSNETPLRPAFDRVLQLGDASACQSPLSFGGFGSMLRHLPRLAAGISQALTDDRLGRPDLAWLQPYQPSLSAAWLFQRSMSVGVGQLQQPQQPSPQQPSPHQQPEQQQQQQQQPQQLPAPAGSAKGGASDGSDAAAHPSWLRRLLLLPPGHINALLATNFQVMAVLGLRVLKPFLQDTLQLGPLALTMTGMMISAPHTITRVLWQVGPKVLLGWFGHFAALVAFTLGHWLLSPLRQLSSGYTWHRLLDALRYGAAADYAYRPSRPVSKEEAAAATAAAEGRAPAPAAAAATAAAAAGEAARVVSSHDVAAGNGSSRFAGWQQHLVGQEQAAAAAPSPAAAAAAAQQWEQAWWPQQQQQPAATAAGAGAGV